MIYLMLFLLNSVKICVSFIDFFTVRASRRQKPRGYCCIRLANFTENSFFRYIYLEHRSLVRLIVSIKHLSVT